MLTRQAKLYKQRKRRDERFLAAAKASASRWQNRLAREEVLKAAAQAQPATSRNK